MLNYLWQEAYMNHLVGNRENVGIEKSKEENEQGTSLIVHLSQCKRSP